MTRPAPKILLLLALLAGVALPILAGVTGPAGDGTDCTPIDELSPEVLGGSLADHSSERTADLLLWRWSAAEGSVLRLRLRTASSGNYEIRIRGAEAASFPPLSAELWGEALKLDGESGDSPGEGATEARFEPVPLAPGYHWLELEALDSVDVQLSCIALRRAGDATPRTRRSQPQEEEHPFLGVQLGGSGGEGVLIESIYPDTAAEKHDLHGGDVILAIDGSEMATTGDVQEWLGALAPGATVELAIRRGEELLLLEVELGRRPDDLVIHGDRADHVLQVLEARPGQSVADIGCGSGWLSQAISGVVGETGTVYAVEIQESDILSLHVRSIPGLVPVLSVSDELPLPENSLDIALLHDVASHIDHDAREAFYDSVTQALKPGGRLVLFGPHGNAAPLVDEIRGFGFTPVDDEALKKLSNDELDERLDDGIVFLGQ